MTCAFYTFPPASSICDEIVSDSGYLIDVAVCCCACDRDAPAGNFDIIMSCSTVIKSDCAQLFVVVRLSDLIVRSGCLSVCSHWKQYDLCEWANKLRCTCSNRHYANDSVVAWMQFGYSSKRPTTRWCQL